MFNLWAKNADGSFQFAGAFASQAAASAAATSASLVSYRIELETTIGTDIIFEC